ncbi:MAG: response regulator [Planctomycetota bacterium]
MPDPSAMNKRILIADDEPDVRALFQRALDRAGYTTKIAQDGEQALELARTFKPDLMILDITMPKMHGMDVLRAMRGDDDLRETGVVMCSARGFKPDREAAQLLGAFDFVLKPVEPAKLLERVEAFFRAAPFAAKPGQDDLLGGSTAVAVDGGWRASPEPIGTPYLPTLDVNRGYWRLWGTRGSVASPGQQYLKHGGNTSCLEVRCGDDLVVIDAGTGIRELGNRLAQDTPRRIPIFIGHTHWDHIQGFPFFTPAYLPGFTLEFYGASGFGKDLESVFRGQLDRDYFPVALEDMHAGFDFQRLESNPVEIGDIKVHWAYAHHPGATVCFRIEFGGFSLGYVTDNEFLQGYVGDPRDITDDHELVAEHRGMIEFLADCDLLIGEAQYTNEEYLGKIGWGHSSIANVALLVKMARIKRWIVTHHDPGHGDERLQHKLNLTRHILSHLECDAVVTNAFDGMSEYL